MNCKSLLIILIGISSVGFAQEGYISIDSAYSEGFLNAKSEFRNNRQIEFTKARGEEPTLYKPEDIAEYGTTKGKVYVSRTIKEEGGSAKYFLRRLARGKVTLYMLKDVAGRRFYSEVGTSLVELKSNSLEERLPVLFENCGSSSDGSKIVKFNKSSLSRYFKLYNSCYDGILPGIRKGILFSANRRSFLISGKETSRIALEGGWTTSAGAFAEIPLGVKPHWLLNIQGFYQKDDYQFRKIETASILDYSASISSWSIPVLFKYRTTGQRIRSYLTAGLVFTYYNSKDVHLHEERTQPPIEITDTPLRRYSSSQLGGSVGVGMEYSIDVKRSLGIEFRYLNGKGLSPYRYQNQSDKMIQTLLLVYF